MQCKNCGNKIKYNSNFCLKCGCELKQKEQKEKKLYGIKVTLGIGLLFLIVILIIENYKKNEQSDGVQTIKNEIVSSETENESNAYVNTETLQDKKIEQQENVEQRRLLWSQIYNGQKSFIILEDEMYIKESREVYIDNVYEGLEELHKEKYAFLDINEDGLDEMMVEFTSGFDGCYLLFYTFLDETGNMQVNAKYYLYRGMEDLRSDGTYISSGGSMDNSLYRVTLVQNKIIDEELLRMQTDYNGNILYYEENIEVLEGQYREKVVDYRKNGRPLTWKKSFDE